MSEEKKEQDDFLSGHEELLNAINKKPDETEPEPEAVEEPVVEETPVIEPEPVVEEPELIAEEPEPVAEEEPEPVIEEAPAVEPEPVVEEPEPIAEEPEPVVEEDPEPMIEEAPAVEPEPVVEELEPIAEEPEPVAEEELEPVIEEAPAVEPEPIVEEAPVVDQKVVADVPPVVTEVPAKPAPKKKIPANHDEAVKQKHDTLEKAEVKEVLVFINKYVKPAAIGILIICVIVLGNSLMRNGRMMKEAKADSALMNARTAADFQAILDDYGKSPSAPLAMLGLAQEQFNAGQLAEASKLYTDFVKNYPKHDMAMQAQFNQITCNEALQHYGDAAKAYGEFKLAHENSHLAPVALLGKARCLEAMNDYASAKLVYEDIVAFYPESGWAQLAESSLSVVNTKLK